MNSQEVINLLRNALECDPESLHHSGYTAKEIHRKCLNTMLKMEEEISILKERLVECKDTKTMYLGWGKGKDE